MSEIKKEKWRLINSGYLSGALNMALDEAMLEACAAGQVPPTLRIYGWSKPTLSLGYFQKALKEVDFLACEQEKIDVVRRLTGGRAVLHGQELTYSLVVQEDYKYMPKTITASYRYLSQGLLEALASLGLEAEMTKPQASYAQRNPMPHTAACFDAPSAYELTIDNKKLIGSAQVRKQGIILQHGSLLLNFSAEGLVNLLNLSKVAKAKMISYLNERVIDLNAATGEVMTFSNVADLIVQGFRDRKSVV